MALHPYRDGSNNAKFSMASEYTSSAAFSFISFTFDLCIFFKVYIRLFAALGIIRLMFRSFVCVFVGLMLVVLVMLLYMMGMDDVFFC